MNDDSVTTVPGNSIAALRRFARPRPPQERCDLCAAVIGEEHDHLLELANRQIQCACGACGVLFSNTQNGKYRRVPKRVESWSDFSITDEQWEALGIPIALAFFSRSTTQQRIVTMYPSPGGVTEATLAGEVWDLLCAENPRLAKIDSDVESLLVNRIRGAREYFRVPIDQCYRLVGIIKLNWKGLSGGTQVWVEVNNFFEELRKRSSGTSANA